MSLPPGQLPPLKPLHPETLLSPAKLATFEELSTDAIIESLAPGQPHCLKTRPDGTILDGHHCVHVLRLRNQDVDVLPREVLERSLDQT
jgi:hypothetical protein